MIWNVVLIHQIHSYENNYMIQFGLTNSSTRDTIIHDELANIPPLWSLNHYSYSRSLSRQSNLDRLRHQCQMRQFGVLPRRNLDSALPCAASSPGPLIRLTRGVVHRLTLHNAASVNTNFHTHGLHIVGDGDGDDVTRAVEGDGTCLDYTWDISEDHPPGTYFYHPHYHGKTNAQVAGGAFGMIIVDEDDQDNGMMEWASDVANEKILLVSSSGTNDYNGKRLLQNWQGSNGEESNNAALLANGVDHEILQVLPDHWYRLRTAVVTPDAEPNVLSFDDSCTVYKVASDGVWHAASLTAYQSSSSELTGASRADFAIRCSAGSNSISWGGSAVATIDASADYASVGGVPSTGDDELDLGDAPTRPVSITDLSSASVADSNRFDVVPEKSSIRFNGVVYEGMSGLGSINYDEVYEMQLRDTNRHPFHLHLYHMQIVTPGGCGSHTEGEFYDTISGAKDELCTVRFRTVDIGQKMVMHCHELEHEDNGSINYLDVINVPKSMINNVDSPSYACPADMSTSVPVLPKEEETVESQEITKEVEDVASKDETLCNLSFCTVDSDCCSGSCQHIGRCSNVDSGIKSIANGAADIYQMGPVRLLSCLLMASLLCFAFN